MLSTPAPARLPLADAATDEPVAAPRTRAREALDDEAEAAVDASAASSGAALARACVYRCGGGGGGRGGGCDTAVVAGCGTSPCSMACVKQDAGTGSWTDGSSLRGYVCSVVLADEELDDEEVENDGILLAP